MMDLRNLGEFGQCARCSKPAHAAIVCCTSKLWENDWCNGEANHSSRSTRPVHASKVKSLHSKLVAVRRHMTFSQDEIMKS